MSRSTTPASRAANGPFSSTVGPGSRPPSAMSRPQSSLNGRRPIGASIPRAASALDTHMEDTSPSVLGKRKGMRIFSLSPSRIPRYSLGSMTPGMEDVCHEFGQSAEPCEPEEVVFSPSLAHVMTIPVVPSTPFPKGPSEIQSPPGPLQAVPPPKCFLVPTRPLRTASASSLRSPSKPLSRSFLSKDSSTKSFDHATGPEWDQDSRERNMEELMQTFMTHMNQQGQASSGLKETVEVYKTRSKSIRRTGRFIRY
jgi:kinesin family protein C1